MPRQETLCWSCEFATGAMKQFKANEQNTNNPLFIKTTNSNVVCFRCPWATEFKPVPGWTATPTTINNASAGAESSYNITQCPCYRPDLEARIAAYSVEQIANKLEISSTFVRHHLKITRQILYIYMKQLAKLADKNISYKKRYALKRAITEDLLDSSREELVEYSSDSDSSQDEMEYNIYLDQTVKGCEEMLKALEISYKRAKRKAQQAAEQTAQAE